MALTLKRWLVIAILGCAAIAVWLLPPAGHDPVESHFVFGGVFRPGYGFARRHGWPDASTRLGEATRHLRDLELRDSIFGARPTLGADSAFTVLIDRQIPDSIRPWIVSALDSAWDHLKPGTKYRTAVAIVVDTTTTLDQLPMSRTVYTYGSVYPPDSVTPVCRVVERFRYILGSQRDYHSRKVTKKDFERGLVMQVGSEGVLSACAVYATFGSPGPEIATWLAQTAWVSGAAIDWTRESPTFAGDSYYSGRSGAPLVDFSGYANRAWRLRQSLSDPAIACTAGEHDRCVEALLQPLRTTAEDREWHASVIDVDWYGLGFPTLTPLASLGPESGTVLSDMVHDLGRAKFETFWTSKTAPTVAFEAAAHEPLGTWLVRWMQRVYGADVLGPAIPGHGLETGLIVLVVALGVAAIFARERRVA